MGTRPVVHQVEIKPPRPGTEDLRFKPPAAATGSLLLNSRGARTNRHPATQRLRRLAIVANARLSRMHPHISWATFRTIVLDAGVDLRDVQFAARHADPRTTHAQRPDPGRTSTGTALHLGRQHDLRHPQLSQLPPAG